MGYSTEARFRKYVKDMAFCLLLESLEINMVKK